VSVVRGVLLGALATLVTLLVIGLPAILFILLGVEEIRLGSVVALMSAISFLGSAVGAAVGAWQARAAGARTRGQIALSGMLAPLLLYAVSVLAFPSEQNYLLGLAITLAGAAVGVGLASKRLLRAKPAAR
jgi:hypothetical protein